MTVTSNSTMEFTIFLKLTEAEARAMKELTGYGFSNFLDVFYKHLGRAYMEPHEKGLKSLFETIVTELPPHIRRIDKTKRVFNDETPTTHDQ
jgi:hypothetical protein